MWVSDAEPHGMQGRVVHVSGIQPQSGFVLLAELSPTPTEELVHMFNELRSDLVLLYELKQACANCEYELQMLRHRHEALARAGVLGAPATPAVGPTPASAEPTVSESGLGLDPTKDTIIDVVGAPLTPNSVRAWIGLWGACPGSAREHIVYRPYSLQCRQGNGCHCEG